MPLSSIGNFLRNPFYYGVFSHKGEIHQGIHVPMISKKTFDEIQAALIVLCLMEDPAAARKRKKSCFGTLGQEAVARNK